MPRPSFIAPTPRPEQVPEGPAYPQDWARIQRLTQHSSPDVRAMATAALGGHLDAYLALADWAEEQGDRPGAAAFRRMAGQGFAAGTEQEDYNRAQVARRGEPGLDPQWTGHWDQYAQEAMMHNASGGKEPEGRTGHDYSADPPYDFSKLGEPEPIPEWAAYPHKPTQYARSPSMPYPYSRPTGSTRRPDGSIPPDTRPVLRYARQPHLHPQEYEGEEDDQPTQAASQPTPQGPSRPPVPEPGSPRSPLWRGATQPNLDRWVDPRDIQAARERPVNQNALAQVRAEMEGTPYRVTHAAAMNALGHAPAPVGSLPRFGQEDKPLTRVEGETHLNNLLAILDDLAEDVARGQVPEEEAWAIREQILADWQRSRRDLHRRMVPHWREYEASYGTAPNAYEQQIMEDAHHPNWDPQEDVDLGGDF